MMNINVTIMYGSVEFTPPKYWFEDGRIASDTGASIGYDDSPMTELEANKLAVSSGIVLESK